MPDDKKPPEPLKPATRVPPKPPPSWEEHIRKVIQADVEGPQDSFGWAKVKRRVR